MGKRPKILMIDNFDSFTFNLVQYLEELGTRVAVVRNNDPGLERMSEIQADALVISPGPGRPEGAGICMEVIEKYTGKIPILGIALGHQCIGSFFGATIARARRPVHGKTSEILCDGKGLFAGITRPFKAMRYHSLTVQEHNFPSCLEISARSEDGEIMGIRHPQKRTEGIQFHPESIMTPMGKRILRNFIDMI